MDEHRDVIRVVDGDLAADVAPGDGGRVAQIELVGTPLLVGPDEGGGGDPLAWGAYPMVPWAGRIRNGRFTVRDTEYQLVRNHHGHAMHGVGFTSEWSVAEHDDRRVLLTLDLPHDDRWPFGGRVEHEVRVEADRVHLQLSVTAGDRAFPVSFGWHPWFRKPTRIDFSPEAMYRRDDEHIATADLVDVPPGPWDDCFVNVRPVTMTIGGVTVELASACTDWVVFDEPDHATCVEPQTAPPDAFNHGPRILGPGEQMTAACQLRIGVTSVSTM